MEYLDYLAQHGVTIVDRATTYIDEESTVDEGTIIHPNNTIIRSRIGCGVTLRSGNIITNSQIGDEAECTCSVLTDVNIGMRTRVGPYAHIHTGTVVGAGVRLGNYIEIKHSVIGDRTKVAHLAYIGDADIGVDCNIGCGVIFVNYNGEIKQRSSVGNAVFIGSNSNIIAPVTIADGVYIAAGTTVTESLGKDEFCIGRVRAETKYSRKRYNP